MSNRLGPDIARCGDGAACPRANVCKRRLAVAYHISASDHYLWADFFANATTNEKGEFVCPNWIEAD